MAKIERSGFHGSSRSSRPWRALDGARAALLTILAAAPLAFGAVDAWAHVALLLLALVGALLLLAERTRGVRFPDLPWLTLIALGSMVVIGVLQCIPIAASLHGQLVPEKRAGLAAYVPLAEPLGSAAEASLRDAFDPDAPAAASLAVDATRDETLKHALYAVVLLLAAATLRHERHRQQLFAVLAATGGIVAALGLLHRLGGGRQYGWLALPPGAPAFGPFLNRNHFAGFLVLVIPAAVALAIGPWLASRPGRPRRRQRVILTTLGSIGGAAAALVMIIAVVASGSRAGLAALALCLMLLLVPLLRAPQSRGPAVGFLMLAVLAVGVAGSLDGGRAFTRLSQTGHTAFGRFRSLQADFYKRMVTWRAAVAMLEDHPISGVGLGAFQELWDSYKPTDYRQLADHAESDVLTFAVEAGALAILPLALILVVLLRMALTRAGGHDPPGLLVSPEVLRSRLWRTASGAAVVATLVHGLVDINLHIPALALVFVALLSILIVPPIVEPTPSGQPRSTLATTVLVIGALLVGGCGIALGPRILGDVSLQRANRLRWAGAEPAAELPHLRRAVRWSPAVAEAQARLGTLTAGIALDQAGTSEDGRAALEHLAWAARLRPAKDTHAVELGWTAAMWSWKERPPSPALARYGQGLLARATTLDPSQPSHRLRLAYAMALLSPGNFRAGLAELHDGLERWPEQQEQVLDVLEPLLPGFLVSQVIPDRTENRLLYAQRLATLGACDDAVHQYERALSIAEAFPDRVDGVRRRVATALLELDQLERAQQLLMASIADAPRDLDSNILLGHTQYRLGRMADAQASFEEAIDILGRNDGKLRRSLEIQVAWAAYYQGDCRVALQRIDPSSTNGSALQLLGLCLEQRAEWGHAQRLYERAKRILPDAGWVDERLAIVERRLAVGLVGG